MKVYILFRLTSSDDCDSETWPQDAAPIIGAYRSRPRKEEIERAWVASGTAWPFNILWTRVCAIEVRGRS